MTSRGLWIAGLRRGSGTMAHHRATLLRLGSGGPYRRSKHLPCERRLRLEELARQCAIRIRIVAAECRIESHRRLCLTIAAGPDPAPDSKHLLEGLMLLHTHTAQSASPRTQWRENSAPDRRRGSGAPLAARQMRFGMPNYSAGLPGSRNCWSAHRWATSSPVNVNEHFANCLASKPTTAENGQALVNARSVQRNRPSSAGSGLVPEGGRPFSRVSSGAKKPRCSCREPRPTGLPWRGITGNT
jgi:hypothetical protein